MSHSKTILIIDDDTAFRSSLEAYFEDEGYKVSHADSGLKGLEMVKKKPVDLILTDLRMPGMDGLEVMKSVQDEHPETPMIVISGAGKKEDVIEALRMGAKDYITKPIVDLERIGHTVQQVFETKRLKEENLAYRRRLEKSESKYRTITEQIAEGVFTVDEDENFTYSNKALCQMTGYSFEELLSRNLQDITTPQSFDIILSETKKRITGLTSRYVIEMITKSHDNIHVELACSPIFSQNNNYSGAIAIVRNITQIVGLRKIYENFLKQKEDVPKDVTPICASCKNVRVEKGQWIPVEEHLNEIAFSHGICPECCQKLYPDLDLSEDDLENL